MVMDSRWLLAPGALLTMAAAAASPAEPPPGYYELSSETVIEQRSGPLLLRRKEEHSGHNGQLRVTHYPAMPGDQAQVQTYAGQGPLRHCVAHVAPAGRLAATGMPCDSQRQPAGFEALCPTHVSKSSWRRVAADAWELQTEGRSGGDAGAVPLPAATQAAMAPVLAELRKQAASADPDAAAGVRAALAKLEGGRASAVPAASYRRTERWRRIADNCPATAAPGRG